LCLAQQWIMDNRANIELGGFVRDDVAAALAEAEPDHPLWEDFERVHVRSFRELLPSYDTCGIGDGQRPVGEDAELVYLHPDAHALPDEIWQPDDDQRPVLPFLLRQHADRWLIANYGSESLPKPGWPPTWTSPPVMT
jgi:hypothetical protein